MNLLTIALAATLSTAPAPAFTTVEPGVQVLELTLERAGKPMTLWLYRPEKLARGRRVGLVVTAAAGSPLVAGIGLSPDDRAEHLPYVRAGFAVAAFSVDGVMTAKTIAALERAAREYQASHAGLDNARTALDRAVELMPEVDPQRIYAAGHSSSGALALLFAARDKRIKAVAAYAPATEIRQPRLARTVATLERLIPEFGRFVDESTVARHTEDIKVPVFLFTAEDDPIVPVPEVRAFEKKLKQTNDAVELQVRPATPGLADPHYEPMIRWGLAAGTHWLQGVDAGAGRASKQR